MKLVAQHARRNLPDGWQATFGPFRIVPARKQLLLGNRVLRLGGRAFDILQILVEHAGQFVSKQTLFDWAWSNLAVDETNLRTAIAAVRRALRESAMTQDLIETEPGHGYRLAIEVKIDLGGSACAALQTPRSRIVGREATVDGLSRLFPGRRLVTIVGPGGIGKTTTALLTARRLLDTRIFDAVSTVDFSSIHDSKLALEAIRSALELPSEIDGDGSAIGTALGRQSRLLLLDSCENVVSALRIEAPRLLAAAPGVAALATSREPLGAPGELTWRLDPLTAPPPYLPLDPIQALRYSAIELFVERAEAVSASFRLTDENVDQVANICRALDGLPFAIELATGRLESFDIVDLATELRDYFCLHMSGSTRAPTRHRTLRAMLDWSYEALSLHEQILMRRLSVFRGTLTTDTVPNVVADRELRETEIPSLMIALANKSLLNVELKQGLSTYKFLNTTRAYALEKLEVAHEAERYARRHVECILGLVATAVAEIDPASPTWLEFCHKVIDEIQCAMEWVAGHAAGSALALQLTSSVTPILKALGLVTNEEAKARITFGPFRLDRSRRTLYCSEKPVPLGEPSYKVLEALLDRPGETIDNITLIRAVWGSLNVEESNLRHAVAALRKALAGAGCERTYVVTVPRRGYRFCEPLSIMAPEVARAEPTPPGSHSGQRRLHRRPRQ